MAALAQATGVPLDTVLQDNPRLTRDGHCGDGEPEIFLPGFHSTQAVVDSGGEFESWDLIAAQNGVDVAVLRRVNGPVGTEPAPDGWVLVPDQN
ncbi:hypothetical protein FRACA_560006 [Frankia canadensis]|uniref:LysM domain-containing protein n=1 Tax=Frankia canadensis TaxID=1836972 RepID=A0A2I2KZ04_9ACTN|nr:hypothetical protein [Frankia canadensis]SNQ50888.1 hypothetical protein FRACA_560006 [Frankia canadensis]SOU58178.1 hypothetical protein FRACA_560006 [Frankia canadensis]